MSLALSKLLSGVSHALRLNIRCFIHQSRRCKVVIIQMHAANQLPHILTVVSRLSHAGGDKIRVVILVHPSEIAKTQAALDEQHVPARIYSYYASSFLLFWSLLVTLDQRMRLPFLKPSKARRICMFHGQPSKGNVYSGFNYKQLDGLFFYGPLMRDYYLSERESHPEWPQLATWELGQPKSDELFESSDGPATARQKLGLDSATQTILYAPSFERCASLAACGEEIISSLVATGCNVIVKPHPSFYREPNDDDEYFYGVPSSKEWEDRARDFVSSGRVFFPIDEQVDLKTALDATDLLITDHSGIAFDAVLVDIAVIHIDCPEFFDTYLPKQFGIDGAKARIDVTCNAGRAAGVTVNDIEGMLVAVNDYLSDSTLHSDRRELMRNRLLFNQGCATNAYVETILRLVEINHV